MRIEYEKKAHDKTGVQTTNLNLDQCILCDGCDSDGDDAFNMYLFFLYYLSIGIC